MVFPFLLRLCLFSFFDEVRSLPPTGTSPSPNAAFSFLPRELTPPLPQVKGTGATEECTPSSLADSRAFFPSAAPLRLCRAASFGKVFLFLSSPICPPFACDFLGQFFLFLSYGRRNSLCGTGRSDYLSFLPLSGTFPCVRNSLAPPLCPTLFPFLLRAQRSFFPRRSQSFFFDNRVLFFFFHL